MIIAIGYPIGITKTDEGYYYTIETKDKYIHLSYEELQVWTQVDSGYIPQTENDWKIIQRLKSVGVLLSADTKKEMLMALLTHCYIRQGFGMVNSTGDCVHLGNRVINLGKRQMTLWQSGNGKNSIDQAIGVCLRRKMISKENLLSIFDDILFLGNNELIYII